MTNNILEQAKLEAFRQNWEQMRHAENMRLTFTNFYALIVAAVLAFVSQRAQGDYSILFIVLAVLSLLGLILCLRIKKALEDHRDKAQSLAGELTGEKNEDDLKKFIPFHGLCPPWYKFWYLRILFPYLYAAAIVFFVLLAFGLIDIV